MRDTRQRVQISKSFYIDQFEVTNDQYARFLRAGSDRCTKANNYCLADAFPDSIEIKSGAFEIQPGYAQLPARIEFAGAEAYCAWVGKRLPTEAEWELAAHHDPGSSTDRAYPWGDSFRDKITNHFEAVIPKRGKLAAVGQFTEDRSAVGAQDMGGNAAEWVADCFTAFACAEPCVDPLFTTNCQQECTSGRSIECAPGRVIRGADIASRPGVRRARTIAMPMWTDGVRCARSR